MKQNIPDPETAFEELFRVREIASPDFVERTLAAARAQRRRARIVRLTAWSSGLAACLVAALALSLWNAAADRAGPAIAAGEEPAGIHVAEASPSPSGPMTNDELTEALFASFSKDDVVFYGHAQTLEALLADAISLADEESRETLDYLFLLAQY